MRTLWEKFLPDEHAQDEDKQHDTDNNRPMLLKKSRLLFLIKTHAICYLGILSRDRPEKFPGDPARRARPSLSGTVWCCRRRPRPEILVSGLFVGGVFPRVPPAKQESCRGTPSPPR